ncbi:hypothetical protein ABZ671_00905 [Micromonospora sp. NPDC006766]|uniref:hypothetical protein n=1 Tax=Micromonospora sp. NPDC006766 TaxID=3154778 RepID=UPI0033FD6658
MTIPGKWAIAAAAGIAIGLAAGVTIGGRTAAKPQPADAPTARVVQAHTGSATVADIEQVGDTGNAYVDMRTPGPSVTVNVDPPARVLVILSAHLNGGGGQGGMSFEVSGASAVRASDMRALRHDHGYRGAFVILLTTADGLRPGVNTFTAKYRSAASGEHALVAADRNITVIPIS